MRLKKNNDIVVILSENSGWYKGHLKDDPKVNGMFPANYVKTSRRKRYGKNTQATRRYSHGARYDYD